MVLSNVIVLLLFNERPIFKIVYTCLENWKDIYLQLSDEYLWMTILVKSCNLLFHYFESLNHSKKVKIIFFGYKSLTERIEN